MFYTKCLIVVWGRGNSVLIRVLWGFKNNFRGKAENLINLQRKPQGNGLPEKVHFHLVLYDEKLDTSHRVK